MEESDQTNMRSMIHLSNQHTERATRLARTPRETFNDEYDISIDRIR